MHPRLRHRQCHVHQPTIAKMVSGASLALCLLPFRGRHLLDRHGHEGLPKRHDLQACVVLAKLKKQLAKCTHSLV